MITLSRVYFNLFAGIVKNTHPALDIGNKSFLSISLISVNSRKMIFNCDCSQCCADDYDLSDGNNAITVLTVLSMQRSEPTGFRLDWIWNLTERLYLSTKF